MCLRNLVLDLFVVTVDLLVSEDKLVPALDWIYAFYNVMAHLVKILPGGPFRPKSQ